MLCLDSGSLDASHVLLCFYCRGHCMLLYLCYLSILPVGSLGHALSALFSMCSLFSCLALLISVSSWLVHVSVEDPNDRTKCHSSALLRWHAKLLAS